MFSKKRGKNSTGSLGMKDFIDSDRRKSFRFIIRFNFEFLSVAASTYAYSFEIVIKFLFVLESAPQTAFMNTTLSIEVTVSYSMGELISILTYFINISRRLSRNSQGCRTAVRLSMIPFPTSILPLYCMLFRVL